MNSQSVLLKLDKKYLGAVELVDFKRMKKKLKESRKAVNTGKKRSFYLAEYIPQEYIVEFVLLQHEYFYAKCKEVRSAAADFLMNEDEAISAGFYTDEYAANKYKEAEEVVSKLVCPEDIVEMKFRRKALQDEIKRTMPEQKQEQLTEWADKAYPNIKDDLWEVEVEDALVNLVILDS